MPSDQASTLAKQFRGMSIPELHLGIVSPCSVCLNQRATVEPDGRPACPRRAAAAQRQNLDGHGLDPSFLDLVVLTGKKPSEQDDGTKALANPVYDEDSNSILVWAAALKDNGPAIGPDGTQISPDILDPGFSSDWLHCKALPFTVRDSEAQYFQQGCLMEGDQVEMTLSRKQQVTGKPDGSSRALALSGTVRKVNLHGQFPRQPVTKDLCVSGT